MSIDEGTDKEDVVRIYNGILLGCEKENATVPCAETWMDLEIVILSEVSHFNVGGDS